MVVFLGKISDQSLQFASKAGIIPTSKCCKFDPNGTLLISFVDANPRAAPRHEQAHHKPAEDYR
jgi:hypothetical protein